MARPTIRNLVVVLGDQLDLQSAALRDFDTSRDVVWMAENQEEATHVWCHKFRLVAFFAPMRHFCESLREAGHRVDYHALPHDGRTARTSSFAKLLPEAIKRHQPTRLVVLEPGDHRVRSQLEQVAEEADLPLEQRPNDSFYCSLERFQQWREGRKQWVLETFYREMRKEHDILIDGDGQPEGGQWNYDKENRGSFGKSGPQNMPEAIQFPPDKITREVIEMVNSRFTDHPGSADAFDLPVTRDQALEYLRDFIEHRLADFGKFQDAMWHGSGALYHSRLSNAINIGLLRPREVVDEAVTAYREGKVPLAACEGFVRQILGWREYVRGVYWDRMPEYVEMNSLDCDPDQDVPAFFWDGQTEMACVQDSMRLLLETAYAHHIQRLMVLGLYAQLLGVHPGKFHRWHMAMYADAIDWVSAPNAIGMSQHGDGGLMATKPYCASGNYINRMSNYCASCRYRPTESIGEQACPFTVLYWDFLDRHRDRFESNMRMKMQIRNLDRKSDADMKQIRSAAKRLRQAAGGESQ
jgi:deoxyribodipyrimidine photolyase-related protein